eukprot:TRINITY_DN44131_c0_g1_i1.p2 TRINITY_DN44131_c0_g1~~TRINITY_DN44131_c0_g1_i1.p2  ORF type:complete len:203 (+),score=42.40 TRINITY_DN44131_c0_g1_i1:1470-2078(+)
MPNQLPEPAEHERGLATMPYRGASWHHTHQLHAAMHISPSLTTAKAHFRAKIFRPSVDVFFSLVPGRSPSHHMHLDSLALMSPEWNDHTYVQKLSNMEAAQHPKCWRQRISEFLDWFKKLLHGEQPPDHFFMRDENLLEVKVDSSYNEESDCKTLTLTELRINGKKRGGPLEPITVGIDVPVMICLFAFDGQLKLLSSPTLT